MSDHKKTIKQSIIDVLGVAGEPLPVRTILSRIPEKQSRDTILVDLNELEDDKKVIRHRRSKQSEQGTDTWELTEHGKGEISPANIVAAEFDERFPEARMMEIMNDFNKRTGIFWGFSEKLGVEALIDKIRYAFEMAQFVTDDDVKRYVRKDGYAGFAALHKLTEDVAGSIAKEKGGERFLKTQTGPQAVKASREALRELRRRVKQSST